MDNIASPITDSMLLAQEEADKLLDQIELEEADAACNKTVEKGDEVLAPMPKLLQLSQDKLIQKTSDLKEKGNQLDLLLLKAESYSHFIKQNQEKSKLSLLEQSAKQQAPTKKKKSASSPGTPNSKAAPTDTFNQPNNLAGGNLMPHQLEALQWLLSLWENGLSGILADEMGLGRYERI